MEASMKKYFALIIIFLAISSSFAQKFSGRDYLKASDDVRWGYLAGLFEGVLMVYANNNQDADAWPSKMTYWFEKNIVGVCGSERSSYAQARHWAVFMDSMDKEIRLYLNGHPAALEDPVLLTYSTCFEAASISANEKLKQLTATQ
jgi:hypothetical protein